jgi:hypothetical protein
MITRICKVTGAMFTVDDATCDVLAGDDPHNCEPEAMVMAPTDGLPGLIAQTIDGILPATWDDPKVSTERIAAAVVAALEGE